jgi:hypothetical protein
MSKPVLSVSDAYAIMNKKIIIGKMSIANLQKQIEFSKLSIDLQQNATSVAHQKIPLITKLNELFELQMREFDDLRQQECIEIYADINALDDITPAYTTTCQKLDKLRVEMQELMEKIEAIEHTIPSQQQITNFTVKRAPIAAASCSAELLAKAHAE